MARERLDHLFFSILGLSAVSWGGLALMAQLERRYVQQKGLLGAEAFADLVAVAWTVPGPVAGNVAVQLGYVLCGSIGAWVAGIASVLPFFLAMCVLAFAYQRFGASVLSASHLTTRFSLVLACLIGVTYVRQAQSLLRTPSRQLLSVVATALLWVFHTPAVFLSILVGSFLAGWFSSTESSEGVGHFRTTTTEKGMLAAMAAVLALFVLLPEGQPLWLEGLRQAGAGLTLFGGGFSAIPVLKGLYPEGAQFPPAIFTTALALTSVCPGPLLNIVPFLGYMRSGLAGALFATLALFLPTGVLAVLVQRWRDALRKSARFEQAISYLRAATTAFLAETVLRLVPHVPVTVPNAVIGLVVLIALWRWKVPAYGLYLGVAVASLVV